MDAPLHSMCLDSYMDHTFFVYNIFVLLAYDIDGNNWPHHHPLSCAQVQQDGEEKKDAETEPLEPVPRSLQETLQMGWQPILKVEFLHQDEGHGFPDDVRADISYGCSSSSRSSWSNHGALFSSNYGCHHCKSNVGSLQLWRWQRSSKVWWWSQASSSTWGVWHWRPSEVHQLAWAVSQLAHLLCDGRYADLIKDVEQLETMTDMATLDTPVQELAMKLYSILSSYLQGPALQIVRAHSSQRNGFAVWHRLKQLYAPRARPRALAIGQAIMQHPSFPQQRTMVENLLHFDMLLDQYELAAGHRMPDDLTVSTVLRCLDSATRRHLEMVMDEGMDYAALKDKLILLDKNTKAWSGDNFLKNLQVFNQPSSSSSTYQGPAPMEIDQVQYGNKGKSKGKSKSKGKKGSWFGFPYGGKSGGHQKGGQKGKSKHKGKKSGKGKNKGKQQKGKGYGGGNSGDTCRICGEHGHWGNECPLKNRVNQVAGSGNASGEVQGVPTETTSTTGSVELFVFSLQSCALGEDVQCGHTTCRTTWNLGAAEWYGRRWWWMVCQDGFWHLSALV